MNTRLFIENREIELDETVQFAITKQFEDLSNPTTIINDWSKTVSIPFTARNNEIFGHIYNPDKLTVEGSANQALTGIYFNPYKKLDMRLQYGDNVLMVGYAKMNEVKQNNGKGTYEITLFGELGKVFQEMKKITFDTTTDDTDYLIHGEDYVEEYLNKELVYNSWTSSGQRETQLHPKYLIPAPGSQPVPNPAYHVTDIIGFAPNNSFSEGFDYKTYQNTSNTSKQFTETLGDAFTQATGVEPDTAIPNGLLPREIGEYRSYLQLPYIYWNKLFQIFQAKAEEVTGYQFQLDSTWFTPFNPYWNNLVYMLYGFGQRTKEEERKKNNYTIMSSGLFWGSTPTASVKTEIFKFRYDYAVESYPILIQEEGTTLSTKFRLSDKYQVLLNNQIAFRMQIPAYYKSSTRYNVHLNPNNAFEFTINALNTSGTIIKTRKYLLCDNDYEGSTTGYFRVFRMAGEDREAKHLNGYYDYYDVYADIVQDLEYKDFGEYATLNYTGQWLNTNYPFRDSNNRDYVPTQTSYSQTFTPQISHVLNAEVLLNPRRSNSYFTLNDLWNNDYNLFNEIIKYCKMFRIGISVDEYNKKIIFKQYGVYFNNYTVRDWTNKIDKSKDYTIKPITFENKYVLFNYKDNDTDLGKKYKDKYGVNYGDYRVITDYNFNTETTELFKDITQSITNTDNVLSWTNLHHHNTIIYSFPSEIFVYNKDKDKKQVSIFGSYFFHNGLSYFNTEEALRLRPVSISDDTDFQQANNTYFYTQNGGVTDSVTTYPSLDIVNGDNLCVFNVPKENYTYLNNYIDKATIYSNFWENYINERYNIQNKKITCYVMLTPTEYNQFQWNKFVKIGNQICIVNKIYDYDITNNQPTKVDLVTIQNINGYTDDTFIESIDRLDLHIYETSYFGGGIMSNPSVLGTFDAVTDVTFANASKTYIANNVKFTIVGNTIYYQTIAEYLDKEDAEFTVTLHNENYTASFNGVRYSTYPYPWIIIENSNGEEVSSIYPGTRVYKFKWHGTDTEGLDNKPTIVIENHGTGSATIGNDWVENQVMIAEGDDEWFRNEYEVTLNTNMTNYSGTYLRFIVTDKEGWHETRDYPISI